MNNDLINRQATIDEIHKYFLSELDKEETEIIDGWEVFVNINRVNDMLTYNKEICTRIKDLPPSEPEIIKCHECAKRRTLDCPMGITVFDAPPSDGYCYKAERRNEE